MILATLVVAISIALFINLVQKPIYSASTDLLIEVSQPAQLFSSDIQSSYFDNRYMLDEIFFDTQAKFISSTYFRELVAEELLKNRSSLPREYQNASKESLMGLASASVGVPSQTSARIIRLNVENLNPELAASLANTIAKVYIRYNEQSIINSSRQTIVLLIQKLEAIRDKMSNSAYSLSELDVQNQLSAALKIYGENHPIVKDLRAKKTAIEQSQQSKDLSDKKSEGEMQLLGGSAQINEELYQVLLKKLQEIDLAKDVAMFNVRVIEYANVPVSPIKPNKSLNLIIGFMMGSFMGVGLAFFREYLDTTVKTTEELKDSFGLTVLGLIPTIDGNHKPKTTLDLLYGRFFDKNMKDIVIGQKETEEELRFKVHRLAGTEQLQAVTAESYRNLRTNLQFAQLDKPLKKLLVTSSIRGEGKTTTCVNLGIILAQTGKNILIVDTDLRRPRIHRAFDTVRDVGLTNLLMGESRLEDVVIATDVKNLFILPSGPLPPNPAELIATEKMKLLIKYMESKYDYIIFDSPPLVAVTDAALLSSNVDGVLLIVEAGALPRDLLAQGLERLTSVKANIVGGVLNNVNLQKGSRYYYNYYYDYASVDKS